MITDAVGSCDVLLALIGSKWLTLADERGRRRVDSPDDFVRLEIEGALARDVRVIPILIDGARMPRTEELPPSLVSLRRRQALELSPSRFEYDTGRLLRVLDSALAEAQTASHPVSASAGPTTPPVVPEATESATVAEPPSARRRTLRRILLVGIPVVAVVAGYLIIQFGLNRSDPPQSNGASSSATGGATVEAPWRLVINSNGTTGCTIALTSSDTRETWSKPYPVWETASFVMTQGGEFRWSVESGCTIIARPGAGNLDLPGVVDGVGTSDAFSPPATIAVTLKDIHGNQRCSLQLRDVATGTIVDIGELTEQQTSVTLEPQGRPLVYLDNAACAVEVSSG